VVVANKRGQQRVEIGNRLGAGGFSLQGVEEIYDLAERITGYLVGGISPFGTSQKLPVVMDESILEYERILINAGQRGTMLIIAPEIIRKALGCGVGSLVQE